MRRQQRSASGDLAWGLLKQAGAVHLATTLPDGAPLLRVLNAAVVDDWVLFHGAVAGEKNLALGRPAIVSAFESVAQVPSYFVDPEKACPATTYFRSAQAKGRLLEVSDEQTKRRMLQSLMEKYQPEGGYRSFLDNSDVYKKDLRSVRVIGVRVEQICGKRSLGQDRPPAHTQKVVEGLWRRGEPGDCRAIEQVLAESPLARPPFMSRGALHLVVYPSGDLASQHADLLRGSYWREKVSVRDMRASIEASSAWLGLAESNGRLVAAARGATDSAWTGRICDVIVQSERRGQGLGRCVMEALLDHPAVRNVRALRLGTKDGAGFYERFGFCQLEKRGELTEMIRRKTAS